MKKISLTFATFVIIGMLIGIFYSFVIQRVGFEAPVSPAGSGTIIGLPVEMLGGVALDPYRDSSFSGTQQLYKGIPIMPAVEINLDCSTAATEESRARCEEFKANIELDKAERRKSTESSGTISTGNISAESSHSHPHPHSSIMP